ncbi:MAG: hypothetical protein NTW30_03605 [Candidatus Aenigmarchaeota archaeon]|nr:hypothetical protein [Candidatus Aenigmarchaeota archaeon]
MARKSGNQTKCGVELNTYTSNIIIIGNDIASGTYGTTKVLNGGSNNIIHDNVGYITEKSGTETIPEGSTSITVNHDLASIPKIVTITPNKQTDFWVTDKTSSQFTINIPSSITGGVSFDWYAEV